MEKGLVTLLVDFRKKDLSTSFLLHQLGMQLLSLNIYACIVLIHHILPVIIIMILLNWCT